MENWANIIGQIPMTGIVIYLLNSYLSEYKKTVEKVFELEKKILILETQAKANDNKSQ